MKKIDSKIAREVERTLQSADDIQRVTGNPFLLTRIRERMAQEDPRALHQSSPRWAWALAASLVLINAISLLQFTQASNRDDSTALYDYYYESSENSDLYDFISQ